MAVAMLVDNPNVNQEIYEKVRAALGLDDAPAGGIVHIAGPSPTGGWRVVEVWESEDDAQRFFRERLGPAFQQVGVEGPPTPPQFWPVHNIMQ
jgi:hypothetical protein